MNTLIWAIGFFGAAFGKMGTRPNPTATGGAAAPPAVTNKKNVILVMRAR